MVTRTCTAAGAAPTKRSQSDGWLAVELARLGVALHSAAGAAWSARNGEAGLLAHELADALPEARRLLQSGDD